MDNSVEYRCVVIFETDYETKVRSIPADKVPVGCAGAYIDDRHLDANTEEAYNAVVRLEEILDEYPVLGSGSVLTQRVGLEWIIVRCGHFGKLI